MFARAALISAFILGTAAVADDQAVFSFSGKGKQPVEVRDASGEVKEVIGQKSLSLNTIPRDAAEREQAYREQQAERAAEYTAEQQAERAAQADQEAAAAKAQEEAAAKAAAEAKAKAEEEWDPTPRKVRRKTVRGTLDIGPLPESKPSSPAPQAPAGPFPAPQLPPTPTP